MRLTATTSTARIARAPLPVSAAGASLSGTEGFSEPRNRSAQAARRSIVSGSLTARRAALPEAPETVSTRQHGRGPGQFTAGTAAPT
jgi:hypothetical protein